MELQIISYLILFLFFNGFFFVGFQNETDRVKQYLFQLTRNCTRVENGTFFSKNIPENTYKTRKWANEKREDRSWIFWNTVANILYENKIIISIINILLLTSCFILPKYL